jgi:archaellum biogenesis ATPase FlaH
MYEEIEGIDTKTYAGKAALAVKTKVRGILGDDLLTFTLLDFVTFMQLNNAFATKGIFITEKNKEEKYIEIIETGDENLIQDLEKYIMLLDNIKMIQRKKEEYCQVIDNLKHVQNYDDTQAVNNIVESYLRR